MPDRTEGEDTQEVKRDGCSLRIVSGEESKERRDLE